MSDRIKCPRCKQPAFANARYSLIRDEFILFDGKCVNCEYEITAEALYEQLTKKFDIDKDFEQLEKPFDYILSKLKSTEEETRKKILETLIKICEEKADKSCDVDQIENYLYKKINYEQILNGKKYSDEEIFSKLGSWFSTKGMIKQRKDYFQKAVEYDEQAVRLDPTDASLHWSLAHSYSEAGEFDKAIEHLDLWFEHKGKTEIQTTKEIEKVDEYINTSREISYPLDKGKILFMKGEYEKVIELLKGVNFTTEMVEHTFRYYKIIEGGREMDLATDLNVEIQRLLLCAYVKLSDLDKALQTYDKLIYINPGYKDLFNYLSFSDDEADDDFDFFCNVIYLLLEKNITEAYELAKQIDINQLQKEHDDLYTAAFLIFVSFLKGRVYLEYVLASDKKEVKLLEDAEKYFKVALSALESWYLGGSIWDNSWPPKEIWESYFGSVDRIRPESHKYMGMILDTFDNPDGAFAQYKKASEYEGYDSDKDLEMKIEEAKLKISKNKVHEWETVAVKFAETARKISLSSLAETERNAYNRMMEVLSSIKDSFPEEFKTFTEALEKHASDAPYEILEVARKIIQGYVNKIERVAKKEINIPYSRRRPLKETFKDRIDRLEKKNAINYYIHAILLLIWFAGSAAAHPSDYPFLKSLKLDDVEPVVTATCTFLRWYHQNYPK